MGKTDKTTRRMPDLRQKCPLECPGPFRHTVHSGTSGPGRS